jgi:hypothetical protein
MLVAPMNETNGKEKAGRHWLKIIGRVIGIVVLALAVGWTINRIGHSISESPKPAGFARGLLQGALMPMALPNLLVGKDVAIYTQNNTGVNYKLGYTAGVNGCGTIFFGFFFWRLRRLKRWAEERRVSE